MQTSGVNIPVTNPLFRHRRDVRFFFLFHRCLLFLSATIFSRQCVCVCVCIYIELHIIAQSGPVILAICMSLVLILPGRIPRYLSRRSTRTMSPYPRDLQTSVFFCGNIFILFFALTTAVDTLSVNLSFSTLFPPLTYCLPFSFLSLCTLSLSLTLLVVVSPLDHRYVRVYLFFSYVSYSYLFLTVWVCVGVFHITAQSAPVILVISCHSHWSFQGGIRTDLFACYFFFFYFSCRVRLPDLLLQNLAALGLTVLFVFALCIAHVWLAMAGNTASTRNTRCAQATPSPRRSFVGDDC